MPAHMTALRKLGVPYTDEHISRVEEVEGKTELDALIAYLQGHGPLAPSKDGERDITTMRFDINTLRSMVCLQRSSGCGLVMAATGQI